MDARQLSSESNDFEVLPRVKDQNFLSLSSAASAEGDPYEQRPDILMSKRLIEELKEKLCFDNEEKINELHETLKSRDAFDAGIVDEVANLDDISKTIKSQDLIDTAQKAREYVSEVRKLANEKKTTAKRALDILEIALPIFIHACDMSENDAKLSDEVASLQEEFEKTKIEMLECQVEFEMEKRAEKLKHSKDLLLNCIEAATNDRKKMNEQMRIQNESGDVERFSQTQSDVELIIGTDREELDAWLVACQEDYSNIDSAIKEQTERHEDATKRFKSRLQAIDVNLEVNQGRQADLMKQLEKLQQEEKRLKDNRCFESQVQSKAETLNTKVLLELESMREKVAGIKENASTAQEIVLNMQLCSELLFEKAFDIQRINEEKLRQLQLEALIRERNALSTAIVEFKLEGHMAKENIREYLDQLVDIRKEIERAAKRGQGITVTKKKSELEEYNCEIDKERSIFEENEKKCTELLKRLEEVDGDLGEYGVSSPSIDALIEQGIEKMHSETTGPASLISMK